MREAVHRILILSTLVLGRFFCGWACHVVACQDLCAWLLNRVGLCPRPMRSRLLVFVPLGAAFSMFAWPQVARLLEGRLHPGFVAWHLTTSTFWRTFPGPVVGVLTFLVDGFLLVWLLGAKGLCTYGCPYGAVVDSGCMKCLDCVNVCPKDALYFGFGAPPWRFGSGRDRAGFGTFPGKRRSGRPRLSWARSTLSADFTGGFP